MGPGPGLYMHTTGGQPIELDYVLHQMHACMHGVCYHNRLWGEAKRQNQTEQNFNINIPEVNQSSGSFGKLFPPNKGANMSENCKHRTAGSGSSAIMGNAQCSPTS